ncbi:50S ribosomal protein L11 methyltransferase [Dongia deserti]|uniref:50S ribosomal protein L11 methyltransferase n=1 Tax=Dongia deserti TaxID=2268030 RepID=UPI0013C49AA6|nr:50S ribosomal protein L11 methyltransferase [Dongia deserti]
MSSADWPALFAEAKGLLDAGDSGAASRLITDIPSSLDSPETAAIRDRIYRALIPNWHYSMMNDQVRNAAFLRAFRAVGIAGKHVLEIGTGAGLLAMMLARENPASLVSCEASPVLFDMANRVIGENGLAGAVRTINKPSSALQVGVDLAQRVDVVVAEIVDSVLVGEGILPSVRDARARLLQSGGRIIPCAMTLYAAPFSSDLIYRDSFVEQNPDFKLSAFNEFASRVHRPLVFGIHPHKILGDSARLFSIDLQANDLGPFSGDAEIRITAEGPLHGYVLWFELELAPGIVVSNPPEEIYSHWGQAVSMVESGGTVKPGQIIRIGFDVGDQNFLLKP